MSVKLQRETQEYIVPLVEKSSEGSRVSTGELLGQVAALALTGAASESVGRTREAYMRNNAQKNVDKQNYYNTIITDTQGEDRTIVNYFYEATGILDENGINFGNNWYIDFGKNETLKDEQINILNAYTTEVSMPTVDIETNTNPLGFTKNEDISGINYGDFSVTFIIDKKNRTHSAIMNVISEMKNRKNGRYGYKSNYMFRYIDVTVNDSINNPVQLWSFENCIIKSISDLTLNYGESEMKTFSCTFGYDRLKGFSGIS